MITSLTASTFSLSEDGIYVVDDSGHPLLQHIIGKFWANNHAHILKGKAGFTEDSLYLFLSNTNMSPIVTGAAQPKINQANLKSFPIIIPDSEVLDRFNSIVHPLFDRKLNNEKEYGRSKRLGSCYLAVWLVKPLNYHFPTKGGMKMDKETLIRIAEELHQELSTQKPTT